jgi:two-component system, chemotaxis family, protein-glutamate methylesterase/glutaminase
MVAGGQRDGAFEARGAAAGDRAPRPPAARASLRVVVADDSAFMRTLLADALKRNGFDVVAAVGDGDRTLAACMEHRPDVLSLDLAMPGLDGIGVLRRLRATHSPVAVVVVSAFSPADGARALDALAEGAVELVAKPADGDRLDDFVADLGAKVRLAASSRRRHVRPDARTEVARSAARTLRGARIVLIACSTGGPRALTELLPKLPSPLGAGVVIVQHMPAGFTASLAARLDGTSELNVREAHPGDRIEASTALVAPGGRHLRILEDRTAALEDEPPIGGLRPRADLTIADLARVAGSEVLLVVLTGMGRDGLEGAREVRRRGGRILAEAESSCTVYGMPRAIVEAGLADGVHDLGGLAGAIVKELAA